MLAVLNTCVLSKALVSPSEEASFLNWMRTTNNFFVGEDYQQRFGIWLTNKRAIQEHNRADEGYALTLNKFAHLTQAEYQSMLGVRIHRQTKTVKSDVVLNDAIDWRDGQFVNPIKDQGSCGSCWAFGAIQAQESQYAIKAGQLLSLSESNLVDCVTSDYECEGCNGGFSDQAYQYVIDHQAGKFMTEQDYPYKPVDGQCKFDASKAVSLIKSYKFSTKGDEAALANSVAENGPHAVAIDASSFTFQFYHSGIYNPSRCSSTELDHEVGVVGYGSENGKDFWIIRNSWGVSWGLDGYMKMIRNNNNKCGVATEPVYPIVQ